MNEIIDGVNFQEYNLTIIRMLSFLNCLGEKHKKKTTKDRLALYDFYLKYPDLAISKNKQSDFDTKYSYFHWVPNYNFYSSILAGLLARGLIKVEEGNYSITNLGNDFFCKMHNKYIEQVVASSEYIILKICKLSNQSIINEINLLIYNERGL